MILRFLGQRKSVWNPKGKPLNPPIKSVRRNGSRNCLRHGNLHRRGGGVSEGKLNVLVNKPVYRPAHRQDCAGSRHEKPCDWQQQDGADNCAGSRNTLIIKRPGQSDLATIDPKEEHLSVQLAGLAPHPLVADASQFSPSGRARWNDGDAVDINRCRYFKIDALPDPRCLVFGGDLLKELERNGWLMKLTWGGFA